MPPPRTSPTNPTPRWPKALGLSAAVGYSLAWVAAATWLSDFLLAAALACGAVALLVLLTD